MCVFVRECAFACECVHVHVEDEINVPIALSAFRDNMCVCTLMHIICACMHWCVGVGKDR